MYFSKYNSCNIFPFLVFWGTKFSNWPINTTSTRASAPCPKLKRKSCATISWLIFRETMDLGWIFALKKSSENRRNMETQITAMQFLVFEANIFQNISKLFQRDQWGFHIDVQVGKIGQQGWTIKLRTANLHTPRSSFYSAHFWNAHPTSKWS